MEIEKLAQAMGNPKDRGMMNGKFFGEPYLKKGVLHLRQDTGLFGCWHDVKYQAANVGMQPLKLEEVCLDLIGALKNSGIANGLQYWVGESKESLEHEKTYRKEESDLEKIGGCRRTSRVPDAFMDMVLYEVRNSAKIFTQDNDNIFRVLNYQEYGYLDSANMRVVPEVKQVNGVPVREILAAYKENLKGVYLSPFIREYKRLEKEKNNQSELFAKERRKRIERSRMLAEKRRIKKRSQPYAITVGEMEDIMAQISKMEELEREEKIRELESADSDWGELNKQASNSDWGSSNGTISSFPVRITYYF